MVHYQVADMMQGVKNLIEAADIREGDVVLLLGDRRSDPLSMEAITAGLNMLGARPLSLVSEPIPRYGHVPAPVLNAMQASDVVIWMGPVFITFTPEHRSLGRYREDFKTQHRVERQKPYHVYFEDSPGLLARDYAKFPNRVLWRLTEKVAEMVAAGRVVRIEDKLGTNLTASYDATRLRALQVRPGDPPGRCHFPWGRCRMFNEGDHAEGEVYLSCVQGVPGPLPEPMRWKVKDSVIVEVDGGEIAEECRRIFDEVPGSNRFVEIMFGFHPKASVLHGIQEPMHWELNSKTPWVGNGTATDHPNYRHMDGAVLNARFYVDDRLMVDEHGMLDRELLYHEDVLEVAAEYGDPYRVLAAVSHEAHGSGTMW